MNYKRLHTINNYLQNRNISIYNNKYDDVYNYINDLKPHIGKRTKDRLYIRRHYMYRKDNGRMLVHINTNDHTISLSDVFKEKISTMIGSDISTIMMDIIRIHFNEYTTEEKGELRYRPMVDFFAENRYSDIKDTYKKFYFKKLSKKQFSEERRKDKKIKSEV